MNETRKSKIKKTGTDVMLLFTNRNINKPQASNRYYERILLNTKIHLIYSDTGS